MAWRQIGKEMEIKRKSEKIFTLKGLSYEIDFENVDEN
jgi:hypothetical protein